QHGAPGAVALEGGGDPLRQARLERPAERVESQSVRSATGPRLPRAPPLVLGDLATLQRLHAAHRDETRSPAAYRALHSRLTGPDGPSCTRPGPLPSRPVPR